MILKPFLVYDEEASSVKLVRNTHQAQTQHSLGGQFFIGFIETKKEQLASIINIVLDQGEGEVKQQVLAWVSETKSLVQENSSFLQWSRLFYIPHSSSTTFVRQQQREKVQNLVTRLIMGLCRVLVLDINSRQTKVCGSKLVNRERGPGKHYYLILGHSLGEVYKTDLEKSTSKIQLTCKINQEQFAEQMKKIAMETQHNTQDHINQTLSGLRSSLQKAFEDVIAWKTMTNYDSILFMFYLIQALHTDLKEHSQSYTKLIHQGKLLTTQEKRILQNQVKGFKPNITSSENSILDYFKNKCLLDFHQLNQKFKWKFLETVKLQQFDRLQDLEELAITKQRMRKKFYQYEMSEMWLEYASSEAEKRLLTGQIRRLNQKIIQKDSQKQLLEFQFKQQKISNSFYQQQIQGFNKRVFIYQSLNQQFKLSEENLQKERNRIRVMELQRTAAQVEINKKTESEKYLQKFIGHLLDDKAQFAKEIEILKSTNEKLQEITSLQADKIQQFRSKLTELNKLEDWAKQSIQNAKVVQNELSRYRQWTCTLQQNFENFKKAEVQKFNYILQRNFQQHSTVLKKNQCLSEQIQKLEGEKKNLLRKAQTDKTKCLYFQRQTLRMLELSKESVIEERNAEQQTTDRNLATVINKINQNYQTRTVTS